MEIGNEIGQKIRSAIKAKLVELGAYVDDELPDYIMVMVANKKTEAQMADDLNLFLSGNTHKFTAWLHVLLEKLQSITSESNAAPQLPPVAKKLPVEVDKLVPSLADEMSADVLGVEKTALPCPTLTLAPQYAPTEPVIAKQIPVDTPKECEHIDDSLMSGIKLGTEHGTNIYEFDEESFEVDSFIDDTGTVGAASVDAVVAATAAVLKHKETRKVSVTAHQPRKRQMDSRVGDEEEVIPQKAKVARVNARMRLGTSTTKSTKSPVRQMARPAASRSRSVMSSVGAVLRHNFEDDEDVYNPVRPSVGSVASVVRVSERKASVPSALQANKSLLMKAMKQAEQSVTRARQLSDTSELQLTDKQRQSALSRLGLMSSSARQALKQGVKKEKVSSIRPSNNSPRKVSVAVVKPTDSDSMDEESENSLSSHCTSTSNELVDARTKIDRMVKKTVTATNIGTVELMNDELNSDEMSDEQEHIKDRTSKKDSRKFVVTLQGPNVPLMGNMEEGNETELDQISSVSRNVVRVKPQTHFIQQAGEVAVKKSRPMERCKFWPACKNAETCPFHHPSVACRKFPACHFGDSCLYIHPMCKFDASCTNNRCPYMHSTPRRHASVSAPVPVIVQPIRVPVFMPTTQPYPRQRYPATTPVQIKCKFFPKCTDVNCTFQHPKPCHFGANCANRNTTCKFTHPEWPDKKLMKWTAPSVRHTTP